jgi:hypothetical protein
MAYDSLLLLDDEARKITVKAAGDISGGDLVRWASGTDVVGSGNTTYAYNDIAVVVCDAVTNCVGLAQDSVSSGSELTVIQQGMVILPAGSNAVSGGDLVEPAGYGNAMVNRVGTGSPGIGRSMTKATALTGFALVRLNV